MPEGHLHAVVDAIAAAGSKQLAKRAAQGAPVPFDLVEVPASGGGAPLFSYRPRTRDFVEEHVASLRALMQWSTAVNVLAGFDGLGDYLLTHGERHVPIDPRERADLALRVMLATMHADSGDFIHTPSRAAAAADGLARCLLAGRIQGTVVVPLLGVRLEAERLEIEDGLILARDDTIDDLPRDARSPVRGRPGTVVVVSSLEDPARAAALAQARPRLRALLTALRLYDHPAPALAPVAWSRMRGDGWASHPFIGTCARATGTLLIAEEHAPAIRGFCALMAQRTIEGGGTAWALRRFELACERADHAEALTDVLLGLRGLLEADHVGSGALADRLAALCAAPGDWDGMRDRVQIAEALEIALMHGRTVDPSRTRGLALELRGHLRALLRDIACGHLPHDLVALAEQHLGHEAAAEAIDPGQPMLALQDDLSAYDAVHPESGVSVHDTREDSAPSWAPEAVDSTPERELQPEPRQPASVEAPAPGPAAAPQPVAAVVSQPASAPAPQAATMPAPQPVAAPEPARVVVPPEPRAQYRGPSALATVTPSASVVQTAAPAQPADAFLPALEQLEADILAGKPAVGRGESTVAPQAPGTAPSANHAAHHDPRSVTETGESFEEAFIRSLTEGPTTAPAADPMAGLRSARRGSRRSLRGRR
ncbi:MAG: hypothetical protein JHD16_14535 [Solirubrobacteraceae bacterium]|nr:hypothetical protein [Solirubrobacteraceae bacterium]